MKSINTLIKINTRELDELRRVVANCEEEKDRLINYHNKMEDELEQEHAIASKNYEMGAMFANYKKVIRERQAIIAKSLRDLEKRLESLKEEITVKFGEVKKYEILLASKLDQIRRQELSAETKQLDEISVNNYLKENADS